MLNVKFRLVNQIFPERVARGKRFIVRVNESFKVANHDFSKISTVPDAVFVQQIPEENDSEGDKFNIDTNSWFSGQVY